MKLRLLVIVIGLFSCLSVVHAEKIKHVKIENSFLRQFKLEDVKTNSVNLSKEEGVTPRQNIISATGQLNANVETLTKKQSLAAIFSNSGEEGGNYDLSFISASILPEVRTLLQSSECLSSFVGSERSTYKERLYQALGYLGTQEDVIFLEKKILSFRGYKKDYINEAYACLRALGNMASRDIAQSRTLLNNMLTPRYWNKVKLRWSPSLNEGGLSNEYQSLIYVWNAYYNYCKENPTEVGKRLLELYPNKLSTGYQTFKYKLNLQEVKKLVTKMQKYKIEHKFGDLYSQNDLITLNNHYNSVIQPALEKSVRE